MFTGISQASVALGVDAERLKRQGSILVVENEPDDVLLLEKMFEKAKVMNPIRVVSTVEDAICYLKGQGVYANREKYPYPILLLVDVHLNGGSGYDILDWVRGHPPAIAIGLVILTGSDVKAVREAYRRGADSFLVKPLGFEEFQNMVGGLRGVDLVREKEGFFLRHGSR